MAAERTRVLYTRRAFDDLRFGGISRYQAELIRALSAPESVVQPVWEFRYSNNHHANALGITQPIPGEGVRPRFLQSLGKRYVRWSESLRVQIAPSLYDVQHLLASEPFRDPSLPGVVTIYDLIAEALWPDDPAAIRLFKLRQEAVRVAERVISISQATKDDLINQWDVAPEKIDVVHLALLPHKF